MSTSMAAIDLNKDLKIDNPNLADFDYNDRLFIELLKSCPRCQSEESQKIITRAYQFAKFAHKGQKRKTTGEDFIVHPISVAKIVGYEIGLGTTSVVAALLHDVAEDTEYTIEDIKDIFGERVSIIVDGLTKIKSNTYDPNISEQLENFKKMLTTLGQDINVIVIKIADRLHNMRTMEGMPDMKQLEKAAENLYVYVPLAHQVGLYGIKNELEDLSFKYRYPSEYQRLLQISKEKDQQRIQIIEEFIPPIKETLEKENIAFKISHNKKSLYSSWVKMNKEKLTFEEIHNFYSVRVVFESVAGISERRQCLNIYAIITDYYSSRKDSLEDWVKNPKPNGFEAIIFDVMGPYGTWIQVQIMSKRMNEIADKGFSEDATEKESVRDRWIKRIGERLKNIESKDIEEIEKFEFGQTYMDVFTPKGHSIELPKNSTVLDFAFYIHTDLGLHCMGAKVNRKLVPNNFVLSPTDQVEIIDSSTQKPEKNWIDFVVSQRAKNALKNYFSKERKQKVEIGQALFNSFLNENNILITDEMMMMILYKLQCKSEEEIYYKIAIENVTKEELLTALKTKSSNVFDILFDFLKPKAAKVIEEEKENKPIISVFNPKEPFIIDDTLDCEYSKCCRPLPPQDAIIYYSPNHRLIIHTVECPEAVRLNANHPKSIAKVKWRPTKQNAKQETVRIHGVDRVGMMLDIASVLTGQLNVNMKDVKLTADDGLFEGYLDLFVFDFNDLKNVIDNLKKIKGIYTVERIVKTELSHVY